MQVLVLLPKVAFRRHECKKRSKSAKTISRAAEAKSKSKLHQKMLGHVEIA